MIYLFERLESRLYDLGESDRIQGNYWWMPLQMSLQLWEYAGQPFVTIKRNLEDRQVGIDADIVDQNGGVVAEVRNGRITLRDEEHYHARVLKGRSAIINKTTGFIPFDFEAYSEQSHVDLSYRCLPIFQMVYQLLCIQIASGSAPRES